MSGGREEGRDTPGRAAGRGRAGPGRARFGFRPRRPRTDVEEELAFHFDASVAELVERGWEPGAAREEARRRFGDEGRWKRELERLDRRMAARAGLAERLGGAWSALAHAWRDIGRSPGFAAAVVLTFGLGIGANATMFGIVDRLLLRPPSHVEEPDRVTKLLVDMYEERLGERRQRESFAYPDFADARQATTLQSVAAYAYRSLVLGHGPEARPIEAMVATAGLFPTLGVRPALGRFYGEEEDRFGGEAVAVLSHGAWQREFGGERDVIGRSIALGRAGEYTVVGVAPAGFTGAELKAVDVFLPLHVALPRMQGDMWKDIRNWWFLNQVARLAPGVAPAAAEAELSAMLVRGRSEEVAAGEFDGTARVIASSIIAARGPLASPETSVARWLMGVSLVILLIAAANVANLMLARAIRRRQETAVRLALGISRRRLVGEILLEGLLLALAGAAAAVLVSLWATGLVRGVLLPDVAWPDALSGRLVGFAAALAAVAGAAAAIVPAWTAARPAVVAALKSGGRGTAGGSGRARRALAGVQAALSVVLLVGAGLFLRSLDEVRSLDLGLDPDGLVMGVPDLVRPASAEGLPTPEEMLYKDRFLRAALERLEARPEVARAAGSVAAPFYSTMVVPLAVPGLDSIPWPPAGDANFHEVTPGYFATMGMSVLRGRGIEPADDVHGAPRVIVVNETFARTVWPGADALGQCVLVDGPDVPCATVIGVVEDAVQAQLMDGGRAQYYLPAGQRILDESGVDVLFVRARDGEAEGLIPLIRRELHGLDPTLRYVDLYPLRESIQPFARSWELGATMFSAFGLLALVVALVGLYGLLSFNVAQRRHEIGVRLALGATTRRVARLVLRESVAVAAAGFVAGALAAFLLAPRIQDLLYGVEGRDPATFVAVAAAVVSASLLAALLPAWRASRVDPGVALKSE